MPRRRRRRAPKRSKRKKSADKKQTASSWAINFVIGSLVVVVLGFAFSTVNRFQRNQSPSSMDLSLEESIRNYDQEKSIAAELYKQKAYPDVWVEILNGNGVSGIASKFTEYLRDAGFDVQRTENADRFNYEHTMVIDRSKNPEKAQAVAKALNIDSQYVQSEPNKSLHLDVTVILGKDYRQLPAYKEIQSQSIP